MADPGSDVSYAYSYDSGPHPLPLFDSDPFPDDLPLPADFGLGFDGDATNFEDIDLNFDDIDLYLPSDHENFTFDRHDSDPNHQSLELEEVRVLSSESSETQCSELGSGSLQELRVHGCGVVRPSDSFCGDQNHSWDGSRVLNSQSPDSGCCDRGIHVPESSQGSGNCGSGVSEAHSSGSVPSSPDLAAKSSLCVDVSPIVKSKETLKSSVLKRKKEREEGDVELMIRNSRMETITDSPNPPQDVAEDKRNAKLMRNRESAQLSRQRKKIYVEELEDKVRSMHSTIQDLNNRISYIMAENVTLRQQLGGGGLCPQPPVGMFPQPPVGMFPHPPMAYPWVPYAPYAAKPQGAPVPLVPIPRLKTQQLVSAAKSKRSDNKKGGKTKKAASVSLLGLLFFMLLFGGLVPMVSVRFGVARDKAFGTGKKIYDQHRGKVLTVNDHLNGHTDNVSEPLVASLYVPRNDRLVKIDGNLIIHSVLASDKSITFNNANNKETGLAIPGKVPGALPFYDGRSNNGRHHVYNNPSEQKKALPSGSGDSLRSKTRPSTTDGKLQEWFLEGLAGPMLSSGMCTEVFQFDISPASAPEPEGIIPVSSVPNITSEHRPNAPELKRGRNRRVLRSLPIPFPGSSLNITKEHEEMNPPDGSLKGNQSHSSLVVSVLLDPREGSDSECDRVIRPNSLSRIFVVVLLDSVKYVTYSCMLPIIGSGPHLVTN